MDEYGIGTYPVGVLAALQRVGLRKKLAALRGEWIRNLAWARAGNWRAVRSSFNGYLAEWHYPPHTVAIRRCGTGWTRRAAIRRLGHHIATANLSARERNRSRAGR